MQPARHTLHSTLRHTHQQMNTCTQHPPDISFLNIETPGPATNWGSPLAGRCLSVLLSYTSCACPWGRGSSRTMSRSARPASLSYSSPNRVRCFAVLMAAWGACGFRPTLHQILRRTSCGYVAGHDAARIVAGTAAIQSAVHTAFSTGRRRRSHNASVVSCSSSGGTVEDVEGRGVVGCCEEIAVEAEERPWLGNGADPMAEARKNLPSSLATREAGEVTGGGKGKGVPAEEVWLNGPFKAPLPPGPVVR